jgi:hypothetical protein
VLHSTRTLLHPHCALHIPNGLWPEAGKWQITNAKWAWLLAIRETTKTTPAGAEVSKLKPKLLPPSAYLLHIEASKKPQAHRLSSLEM